jgi:hypothetical protein
MASAMVTAARKYATRPERINRLIGELTKTPQEQEYAVRHLREAGPNAVPFLIGALKQLGQSPKEREQIVRNMGRLDRSAISPLATVLASPDPVLATDIATVLALIGDREAIPYLTFPAVAPDAAPEVRRSAQAAIASLTGQLFTSQTHTPVQVLTTAAWHYHRHQVEHPDNPTLLWEWDNDRKIPVPHQVAPAQADLALGLHFIDQALRLDPHDRDAKAAYLSLALENSIQRYGYEAVPSKDETTCSMATASGPALLGDVLKTAIAHGETDLAALAATLLGQVTHPTELASTNRPHPLVDALYAPGRRVQFAAAKALVTLQPTTPFPGSSRVVPTLARFTTKQVLARAIVIDSNPNRGSQLAGFLINLGYDPELELTGNDGFQAAADSADVELILISYDLFRGGWGLRDTLANLAADSRTAATPTYIYGPLNVQYKRPNLDHDYPAITFLVQPGNAEILQEQLKKLPAPLGEPERARYAQEATKLLTQAATSPVGPLIADLAVAEPALAVALNTPDTALTATTALAHVPTPSAQRTLANLALDPSQPSITRKQASAQLVRSIQRFGRLITANQEVRLATSVRAETDPSVQADLAAVVRALLPASRIESPADLSIPTRAMPPVRTPTAAPATLLPPRPTTP